MDFMEISRKRKTVRRFSQTPVEQEKLEKRRMGFEMNEQKRS